MRPLRAAVCLLAAAAAMPARADVVTDGTVGPRVRLGGDFEIGADLGRQAGRNLFHSFERFSLAAGERATFSGPDQIHNVISRVTGGARSDIDGTIASTIPGADFYFLNPAGVAFGPNASLDLQGSFHVSTADELRFADGARFSASDSAASSFTVASPQAFGFLGAHDPAPILVDRSFLQVAEGEVISLAAGDVTIDGGVAEFPIDDDGLPLLPPPDTVGELFARAGRIMIVAVDDTADVNIPDKSVVAQNRGSISIVNHGSVFVGGNGGGDILLFGNLIQIDGFSSVAASNNGSLDAEGMIFIEAESLEVLNFSAINGNNLGAGNGTPVRVQADRIVVSSGLARVALPGGSAIVTAAIIADAQVDARGHAGNIVLRTSDIQILGTGFVSSSTAGIGDAGSVDVRTGNLLIQGVGGFAGIFSNAEPGSEGDAGDVTVRGHQLRILDGRTIGTNTFGAGDAGTVTVHAGELLLQGSTDDQPASIRSDAQRGSEGDAGTIEVTATDLRLIDSGVIGSGTFAEGNAGRITVKAERLFIDAAGSPLLTGITTQAAPGSTGNAGRIDVTADVVTLLNDGKIESDTSGSGNAGRVRIVAGELKIREGGEVRSVSFGGGDAGEVIIGADRILLRGSASDPFTGVATEATVGTSGAVAQGNAGRIRIRAGNIEIVDGGAVSSSSAGPGEAGEVIIRAADRLSVDNGSITTDSALAGGGEIRLRVGNVIDLRHSAVTTSVFGGEDPTAGNILIDPEILVIDGSRIQANANAPRGFGGRVTIIADNILVPGADFEALLAREDISASGGTPERAGTVAVNAPEVDLSGGLVVLEGALLDAASELRERCGARRDIGASSFTGVGRGGLPPSPDRPLSGAYLTATPSGRGGLEGPATMAASSDRPVLLAAPCLGEP